MYKHLLLVFVTFTFLSGCASSQNDPLRSKLGSPASNPSLNAISPSNKKAENALFHSPEAQDGPHANATTTSVADSRSSSEPDPNEVSPVEDTNLSEKLRLQYYVDKWNKEEERRAKKPSHEDSLKKMPVIGTPR